MSAPPGEPIYELCGYLAWDALYKQEDVVLNKTVGQPFLTILGRYSQLTTICSQLRVAFIQARFQYNPVFARVVAVGQHTDDIDNGEPPLGISVVPNGAYFFVIEESN